MLTKRVIPCLDVRNGRVTKGVKFKNNVDLGDPCLKSLEGRMESVRDIAPKTDSLNTYQGFGTVDGIRVIDYIYESGFKATPSFETITKTYKDVPFISDHYPVAAVLVF